jgi:hypothetical protein
MSHQSILVLYSYLIQGFLYLTLSLGTLNIELLALDNRWPILIMPFLKRFLLSYECTSFYVKTFTDIVERKVQ